MIYRILKKSVKVDVQKRAFFSGFGSILSMSPALPSFTYKGQEQDLSMLAKDMQKIGDDFQTAIAKVVNEPKK